MTAIICALYDEAYELIKKLYPNQKEGIRFYSGWLCDEFVAVFLIKPGFTKRQKLRRFLRLYPFTRAVSLGFAGALNNSLSLGDHCKVSSVQDFCYEKIFLAKGGHSLVTVGEVLTDISEKNDLQLLTGAQLVDMEGYRLAQLFNEKEFHSISFSIYKIVGDTFADANYLEREVQFRGFFSSYRYIDKIRIVWKAGLYSSYLLYRRKRFLQNQLASLAYKLLRKK